MKRARRCFVMAWLLQEWLQFFRRYGAGEKRREMRRLGRTRARVRFRVRASRLAHKVAESVARGRTRHSDFEDHVALEIDRIAQHDDAIALPGGYLGQLAGRCDFIPTEN